MKFKVTHNTTYDYGETVPICQNQAHLTPRNDGGQTRLEYRLSVQPTPSSMRTRNDYFGNEVSLFSVTQGHPRLSVTATSVITVERRAPTEPSAAPKWESVRDGLPDDLTPHGLQTYQFRFPSPHVPMLNELADYGGQSFRAKTTVLEALQDLTGRIHRDFTYDPTATTVSTPVEEVFVNRRGVCQDLAHLQLACLRSLGIAARYVSGYLRTEPPEGQPRLVGADASHAWIGVYCGRLGWIDADPTNNSFPSTDHITLAWGRDYSDVCPINGMFIGRGEHQMQVSVDVIPVSGSDDESADDGL